MITVLLYWIAASLVIAVLWSCASIRLKRRSQSAQPAPIAPEHARQEVGRVSG